MEGESGSDEGVEKQSEGEVEEEESGSEEKVEDSGSEVEEESGSEEEVEESGSEGEVEDNGGKEGEEDSRGKEEVEEQSEQQGGEESEAKKRKRSKKVDENELGTPKKKQKKEELISEGKRKEKPLEKWTAEELQTWLKKDPELQEYAHLFRMSGKKISLLEKEDFLRRCPESGDLIYYSLQKLKESTTAESIADPSKLEDPTLPPRNDERWDFLRDIKKFKELQGKTVELPILAGSDDQYPKEMNAEIAKKFLITDERIAVMERFHSTVRMGQKNVKSDSVHFTRGLILSGPFGVGKSLVSYLLACSAYVSDCILFYVPLARDWASLKDDDHSAQYLLERFIRFNAQRAASIIMQSDEWKGFTVLEVAMQGRKNPSKAFHALSAIMEELASFCKVPVVYIVDEHNEIWRYKAQDREIFSPFTAMSDSDTAGARTYMILSGSAHSKFERPAMESWLYPIVPFNREMFEIAINSRGPMAMPGKWSDKKFTDLMDWLTGRTPREIQRLRNWLQLKDDPMEWARMRTSDIDTEFIKWCTREEKHMNKFHEFLDKFFEPATVGKPTSRDAGEFFDTGLVYYDSTEGLFHPTSYPAQRCLMNYYYKSMDLQPISTVQDPRQRGFLFEKFLTRILMRAYEKTVPAFLLPELEKNESTATSITLPEIFDLVVFEGFNLPRNPHHYSRLYKPANAFHPYWDLIIHTPTGEEQKRHTLIFVQISLETVRKHDKRNSKNDTNKYRIKSSFQKSDKDSKSQIERLSEAITGDTTIQASIKEDGTLKLEGKQTTGKFLFISGAEQKNHLKRKNEDEPKYSNLFVITKEVCVKSLNILF